MRRVAKHVFPVAYTSDERPNPKTILYRGDGLFMLTGPTTARDRGGFKPSML